MPQMHSRANKQQTEVAFSMACEQTTLTAEIVFVKLFCLNNRRMIKFNDCVNDVIWPSLSADFDW